MTDKARSEGQVIFAIAAIVSVWAVMMALVLSFIVQGSGLQRYQNTDTVNSEQLGATRRDESGTLLPNVMAPTGSTRVPGTGFSIFGF